MSQTRGRSRTRTVGLAASALAVATLATACASAGSTDAGSATAASTASAPACAPSTGKVTLTFWNWGTGMDKVVNLWNSQNPNIQVDLKTVPSGNAGTYQNLFNGLKAGTAPDLAPVEYDTLSSFRLVDGLQDISGCAGVADAKSKFVPWTWQQVQMGGSGVYGVPQDIGPLALYYRKDIFDKNGLAAPTTWDEYYQDAKKLKAADPKSYISFFSQADPNWFTGLLWQNTPTLFSNDAGTWKVSIDTDQTRKVADYWQKMLDENLVAKDLQGFSEALNKAWDNGSVLTWISAPWGWSTIRDGAPSTSGKWAVAPIPQWDASAPSNGNWGGSTVAVLSGGKHPYEAAQFALWLNSDPQAVSMLIKETGIYPAATTDSTDPFLSAPVPFYGGQKIFDVFAQAATQVNPDFVWGPTMTDTYRFMSDGVAKTLAGSQTLSQTLTDTEKKTKDAITAQGITVAP